MDQMMITTDSRIAMILDATQTATHTTHTHTIQTTTQNMEETPSVQTLEMTMETGRLMGEMHSATQTAMRTTLPLTTQQITMSHLMLW